MNSDTPFNLLIFTDSTKKICLCSALSIFIIVMFIISPLSYFVKTSLFMKLFSLILLVYTIYLNYEQTEVLRTALNSVDVRRELLSSGITSATEFLSTLENSV